jgi:hypothetical protein
MLDVGSSGTQLFALSSVYTGMAKSRVAPPQDVLKVRRLPVKKGDEITVRATVTRVDDVTGRVTIQVPGALAPITAPLSYLLGDED